MYIKIDIYYSIPWQSQKGPASKLRFFWFMNIQFSERSEIFEQNFAQKNFSICILYILIEKGPAQKILFFCSLAGQTFYLTATLGAVSG